MSYEGLPSLKICGEWPHKNFLILGEWLPVAKAFLAAGFKGVMVVPPTSAIQADDPSLKGMELVKINIGLDQHFRKLLSGEYVKATTIGEIFDRWNGPFDVIAVNVPMQTRQLWYTDQVRVATPKMYVLPEDGHNEYVIENSIHRGYRRACAEAELLVMVCE